MPTIFRNGPFRFFFSSLCGGEPRHVHVEASDGHCKFWLDPLRLARNDGFRSHTLNEIHKLIEDHHDIIGQKWHEHFGTEI